MTDELNLVLRGEGAEAAAAELERALSAGEEAIALARRETEALPEAARKALDPVSLAALILAIPSAALATWDLADRIRKRKRAQRLLDAARRLRIEKRVETYVVTLEGPKGLDEVSADELLELAADLERGSQT
jgi:hypothetical protein